MSLITGDPGSEGMMVRFEPEGIRSLKRPLTFYEIAAPSASSVAPTSNHEEEMEIGSHLGLTFTVNSMFHYDPMTT